MWRNWQDAVERNKKQCTLTFVSLSDSGFYYKNYNSTVPILGHGGIIIKKLERNRRAGRMGCFGMVPKVVCKKECIS